MGYQIIERINLNSSNVSIKVFAPLVALKAQAGQFVILRPLSDSERIPLTISDYDRERGTITLVFAPVGETTAELNSLCVGDEICDVCGPLGNATVVGSGYTVVIGGGVGSAIALPVAKAVKASGGKVTAILGFKTEELVILEDEFRTVCDEVIVTTDDGSYGIKGSVVAPLTEILKNSGDGAPREVFAVGSLNMMKYVSLATKPFGVKTTVSMNPIMIDGTGMCGGCRLRVGGEMKFACVDGPDFDGHAVDFDSLIKANARFSEFEQKRKNDCKLFKM